MTEYMLKTIPTIGHLSRLYYELRKIGAPCVGDRKNWPYGEPELHALLILASLMLRYDPRLMTILVSYFFSNFQKINPAIIRASYPHMSSPQVWAVISEFIIRVAKDEEIIYWAKYLQQGMKPVSLQFFYYYIYQPGGMLSERAIESSLAEYKKWGFLACEKPEIDVYTKETIGSLDKSARLNILKKILKEKKEIKLADYLSALENNISRQQALTDIKNAGYLVCRGKGRGAVWRKGRSSKVEAGREG